MKKMKSLIEIRTFAVERAAALAGPGASAAGVIDNAKALESYIVGNAALPEVAESELAGIGSMLSSALAAGVAGNDAPATKKSGK